MKNTLIYAALFLSLIFCPIRSEADTPNDILEANRVQIEKLAVSFRPIAGWHLAGRQALVKNLQRYKFSEDELRRILSTHSGSRTIASFMRDDPRITSGIIPTLNIIANPSSDTSEEAVRAASQAVIAALRSATQDVKVIEDITELSISQTKLYRFIVEFSLTRPDGAESQIRSLTYVFPRDGVLLQISMSEAIPVTESRAFAAFIDALEINK